MSNFSNRFSWVQSWSEAQICQVKYCQCKNRLERPKKNKLEPVFTCRSCYSKKSLNVWLNRSIFLQIDISFEPCPRKQRLYHHKWNQTTPSSRPSWTRSSAGVLERSRTALPVRKTPKRVSFSDPVDLSPVFKALFNSALKSRRGGQDPQAASNGVNSTSQKATANAPLLWRLPG